jgi:hypothetical protein
LMRHFLSDSSYCFFFLSCTSESWSFPSFQFSVSLLRAFLLDDPESVTPKRMAEVMCAVGQFLNLDFWFQQDVQLPHIDCTLKNWLTNPLQRKRRHNCPCI